MDIDHRPDDVWIEYVIPVEVSQDELTALSFNWHGKTTADTLGRMASIAHVTILADYWACACGDRAVRMVSTPKLFSESCVRTGSR